MNSNFLKGHLIAFSVISVRATVTNVTMNSRTETLLFMEELMTYLTKHEKIYWTPSTTGSWYKMCNSSKFNPCIGEAVLGFREPVEDPLDPCALKDYVPYVYTHQLFLRCCSKLTSCAIRQHKKGNFTILDYTTVLLAELLEGFMDSGDFEREGGWLHLYLECRALQNCSFLP